MRDAEWETGHRITRTGSLRCSGELWGRAGLTNAYESGINVCMRTTLNIDDALLAQAGEFTGETEKTALVRMGLQALIEREAARRLAALGGSMPTLTLPARRRQKAGRRK